MTTKTYRTTKMDMEAQRKGNTRAKSQPGVTAQGNTRSLVSAAERRRSSSARPV